MENITESGICVCECVRRREKRREVEKKNLFFWSVYGCTKLFAKWDNKMKTANFLKRVASNSEFTKHVKEII